MLTAIQDERECLGSLGLIADEDLPDKASTLERRMGVGDALKIELRRDRVNEPTLPQKNRNHPDRLAAHRRRELEALDEAQRDTFQSKIVIGQHRRTHPRRRVRSDGSVHPDDGLCGVAILAEIDFNDTITTETAS